MWFTLLLIFLGLVYYFLRRSYSYWKVRYVPGPEPTFILGNLGSSLIGKKSNADVFTEIYRNYEEYPFVGCYRMFSPVLLIRDPEFIKRIVVKDFKHFQNNDMEVDKHVDRIFGRNPFVLKGTEWKMTRAQLTPCFSSGKVKAMFPMLEEVSERMVQFVEEKSTNGNALLESRELCVRYTLDNVAACAFGLEGNCFKQDYSMFRKLADEFLSPATWQSFKISVAFIWPALAKWIKIKMVSEKAENQLIQIVRESLAQRRKNNIVRNDFLESVAQLFKTSNRIEDELDVTAHAASFFGDGYETSSRAMSFVLFELATHPHYQKKLREEIENQCGNFGGKLTYEIIQELPFLDACLNESLRKNPIFGQLMKVCTEQYSYTCTDPKYKNLSVTVEPGTSVILPVAGLHKDETFFNSPEEFRPERFLDKSEINKYCFLPFGEGPRACLGIRFGLTQVKLGVAQLIRNFELSFNSKTKLPLTYDKWYIMLCPIGGLWVDFKRIKQ